MKERQVLIRRVGKYDPLDLKAYEATGGLLGLRQTLAMGPQLVIEEIERSELTGRGGAESKMAFKWDLAMNASKLDLSPAKYEFGDLPMRPVAVPGKTPLI